MITTDAAAMEARYAKPGAVQIQSTGEPPPIYAPGMGIPPPAQPIGTPVPEGKIISQVVGRGVPAPSMMVVPPKSPDEKPGPQVGVVAPYGATRTTIGTFVEPPSQPVYPNPQISPTNSNPVVTVRQEPPVVEEKPKKKLDLVQEILNHIHELGGEDSEECQKFYDRSKATLVNWCRNPATIPLGAVVKFLQKRPGIQVELAEALEPHFAWDGVNGITSLPNRGKTNVVVCAAILERPTLPFMWTLLYLAKKYELGFDIQADTMIHRSRNMLAKRFLDSGAMWSLWIDGDIAAPIANADWFKWVTRTTNVSDDACRFDVLGRLVSHNKAVVGGVYAARQFNGRLVMQPEIKPRHAEDRQLTEQIRKGTARELAEVDWVGFGCALVHREVFLEVQRRFPDLKPETEFSGWRFFQTIGDEGEDEAFCARVKACSIPIYLDTQLICGHIGNMAFLPEHTQRVMAA